VYADEEAEARRLFGTEESEEKEGEGDPRKGVHWDENVVDNQKRTEEKKKKQPIKRQASFNQMMNESRVLNEADEFNEIYKGQETEKVWIDFGKQNSNVMRYDPETKPQLDFNGHRLYYMLPPSHFLKPANVVFFEIINLSSKNSCQDEIVAWGALPIVNGEFELNTGKFKIPMLVGSPIWTANKFKDIEARYRRNIDEWLCNLYVEVKKVELFDFRMHAEKIEFTVPKKFKQLIDK